MSDQNNEVPVVVPILEVKRGSTKRLIMDIFSHTDDVNEKGEPDILKSIPKEYFRGYRDLKDKIFASLEFGVMEIPTDENGKKRPELIVTEKTDMGKLEWLSLKKDGPKIPPEGFKIVANRYSDTPVSVSPSALKALIYFYNQREELPDVEIEAIDELENLVGLGIKK